MSAYSIQATQNNIQSPKLAKGQIRIYASVAIYWMIGQDPQINATNSAILEAGESINLRLPFSCSQLAIQAIDEHGSVTVTEVSGGAKASCSA